MNEVRCSRENHAREILDILNEAIVSSTALYDYQPRTLEAMDRWFREKAAGSFPVIGIAGDGGNLLGFATYGTFRAWPAYKYTVEHSVYVHRDHRGKGIGRRLMERLIQGAVQQQYHVMVGVIDSENVGSIRLHESLGFRHAGTIRQVGYKFGRWLDVSLYQCILDTPSRPDEQ